MRIIKNNALAGLVAVTAALLLVLSACIPGMAGASADATATPRTQGTLRNPTPTPEMASYRVLANAPVCQVVSLKSIKTNVGQGNTFAWSPDGNRLAWIVPTEAHQWYAGSLMVASGPDFANPVLLAQNATGSVTWSPDGEKLAFSSLRISEGIYTIMSVNVDGTGLKDLFSGQAAKLDSFTSPKVITAWKTPGRLNVLMECGSGCQKMAVVDPDSGVIQQVTDAGAIDATSVWRPERNVTSFDPAAYPEMVDPNLSADGSLVTYFEQRGYLWILEVKQQQAFRVDIENYTPIFITQEGNRETHWSAKNWLAVRIDDLLQVFPVPCPESS